MQAEPVKRLVVGKTEQAVKRLVVGKIEQVKQLVGETEQVKQLVVGKIEQVKQLAVGEIEQVKQLVVGKIEQVKQLVVGEIEQVKQLVVGEIEQANLQLPEWREKSCTIRFDLAVLLTESKLSSEPVKLNGWIDKQEKTKTKQNVVIWHMKLAVLLNDWLSRRSNVVLLWIAVKCNSVWL